MTKRYKIAHTIFLACFFGYSINVKAQDKPVVKAATKDTTRTSVTEEIEVIRSYKPVLADAVKIRRSPNLNDTKAFNPKVSYDLLDKRLELNSGIRELEAQKLILAKQAANKNNFAKIGLGNLGTTLGQLNLATGQDEALQAGFNFNHLGMKGRLTSQDISKQEFSGFGRSIGDALVLEGKLSYNRSSLLFYGIGDNNNLIDISPEKQKFNIFEGEGLVYNRSDTDDESNLDFAGKVNASLFNNAFSAKESSVILSGGVSKNLSKFQIGANGLVDFTSSKDVTYSLNNHFFKVNPYIKINTEILRLTAGINYVNEFGSKQRIHFFPAASLDFMLIKNYLTIFGNFGGDVAKTRLKDLTGLNPYLNENINIKNTITKFDAAGGIRGTFAANIGYKAMVSYQTLSDFSYFVNNIDQPQKFDVAYFTGNTKVLGFTGEVIMNFSDAFNLDSKLTLKQYDNNTEQNAWLYPGFVLNSTASFKIVDKVKVIGDLLFQGDSKAKILSYDTSPTPQVITTIKTIKAFADISIGAEYQYNKQISAFLRVNNILGNEYQKYPYYPNYGINILGGVSYGF